MSGADYIDAINILTLSCAIAAIYYGIASYRLLRSNAVLFLCLAYCYIGSIRAIVTFSQLFGDRNSWIDHHSAHILAPFYLLLAVGLFMFYRTLKRFRFEDDDGEDE